MASTKLKDKAIDKDNLIAKMMPSALISISNYFSKSMEDNAKQLVC